MSMTMGELDRRLCEFVARIEARGPVTDPNKKIVLSETVAFTPAEVAQLHGILECFPPELELSVLAALQGAISRVIYLTNAQADVITPLALRAPTAKTIPVDVIGDPPSVA
jgi:hypothetical protein